jgi:hypothetical protein
VDKRSSIASSATLSYRPAPVISSIALNNASPTSTVITLMRACGGDSVTLTGMYMGVAGDSVSVTYSNGGAAKMATGCAVVDATSVMCSTVAGVGSNYVWVVTNGQASAPFGSTSYLPPAVVSSVFVAEAGSDADISTPGAHTLGGDLVVFVGSNFGLSTGVFTAESSSDGAVWTWSPACVQRAMRPNGVVLACTLTPGFGTGFRWQLHVNGQQAQTIVSTTNYRPPTVTRIATATAPVTGAATNVLITGLDFGPMVASNVITATYGPAGDVTRYAASGCTLVVAQTTIKCSMAAGTGKDAHWVVTVGGQASAVSSTVILYAGPFILSLTSQSPLMHGVLATAGGDAVYLSGVNFGDVGSVATAYYGPRHYVASCVCVGAFVLLQCTTAPGYGTEHYWSVTTTDGQTSPATPFPWSTSYAAPAITSVATQDAATTATMLRTTVGDVIVLTGTNFGPTGAAQGPLLVTYAGTGMGAFTAANCAVTTADTQITCTTVVGVGAYFAWKYKYKYKYKIYWTWTVEVGGQASPASIGANGTTSFAPPDIDSVVASPLLAAGGGSVSITGKYFGPVGTAVAAVYTRDYAGYYNARCAVIQANVLIECVAAPGVGKDFTWVICVGSQHSASSSGTTSYAIPVVNALQLFPTPTGATGPNTAGGDEFSIHGRNFGPAGTPISVVYESNAHRALTPACTVMSDALASCTSVAGTGVGYAVTVHVGDQTSAPSTATLNYGAPIITGVNTGVDSINQVEVGGGTVVTLTGQNFGPVDAVHNEVAGTFGATAS